MPHVHHRSSAGANASAWWEYNPARKTLQIALPRAYVTLDICSANEPRFGAFPIHRVDETTWRVPPVRYMRVSVFGKLVTETWPPHDHIGTEPVTLLDAPESIALALAELVDKEASDAR